MKKWLFIFLLFQSGCRENFIQEKFQLQKGDFLFQDLDSSPLCEAIELVTSGYKNANLSHVAIVVETKDSSNINTKYEEHIRVLEAIPNKVKTTRLDSFLSRSLDKNKNPKVIVGRLKAEYNHIIKDAISYLQKKINEKYDEAFLINNGSYYCSELIYEAFKKDNIFELQPMNFLDPQTNQPLEIWKEYYSKIGIHIPQGDPGINPGSMSLSKKINIIHYYGLPDGIDEK